MWCINNRLCELWAIKKSRPFTDGEKKEFYHCLEANMNKCRRVAQLKELSLLASKTNDIEWQHDICAQLDKMYADLY